MIDAFSTSEIAVNLYDTTRRNNPEDLHTRSRENLKYHRMDYSLYLTDRLITNVKMSSCAWSVKYKLFKNVLSNISSRILFQCYNQFEKESIICWKVCAKHFSHGPDTTLLIWNLGTAFIYILEANMSLCRKNVLYCKRFVKLCLCRCSVCFNGGNLQLAAHKTFPLVTFALLCGYLVLCYEKFIVIT
jgi:hypothetical protein